MLLLLWEYMEKRLGKKVIFKDLFIQQIFVKYL